MRIPAFALTCFGLAISLASDARGNFVVNGGFESPVVGSPFQTFAVNSTGITGWTVISGMNDSGSGSVDLYNGGAPAHSGNQVVDLDGTGGPAVGGLSQNVSGLTLGSFYTLDFFFANNPVGSNSSALISIGNLSETISHSGSTFATMNYSEATYTFQATNSLLSFTSLDPSGDQNGMFIDDVSIVSSTVPEPSTLLTSGIGMGLLLAFGAHRRNRPARL